MSAPVSTAPSSGARFTTHAWWVFLLTALTLHWVATERRIARVNALTNSPTWSVDAPPRDPASPTGFVRGQRKLIVPGHHNPSFWWIMEAQQAVAAGRLRLRHIDYDAPPAGRDIRRTAPYRWWLVAVGGLQAAVTGEPLGYAIERGALIADPLLLALLLGCGAAYSARYLGSFAAVGYVLGGIFLFPLAANFQPGAPDPHSLAWCLALGSVLPLLASSRLVGAQRQAHFMVAGVFGGLGLWNDAATQLPVLLAISLGALGGEFIRARGDRGPAPAPCGWRAWALAGGLTTLAASLFEFAPDHLSWSLDAVHPVHAVVWWGLGETVHAAGLWCRTGRQGFGGRALWRLVFAGLAVAAWPLVGILSGSGALLASDFNALELANHPNGGFAPSLGAWLRQAGGGGAKWAILWSSLLCVVLLARLILGRLEREERARLVFLMLPALCAVGLACLQLRWWNLFDVFALVILTELFAEAVRARLVLVGATLLVLPGLWAGFPPADHGNALDDLSPLEGQALIARDFAYWLNQRGGAEPTVLFSTPVFSGAAAYYGNFSVVASGDDGNKTGYLTAVRIASANTPQEGSILLNSRGVTHVALPLWDPALDQLVRLGMNLPADQPLPPGAFSVALRQWYIPLWLQPMDYLIPHEPRFQGFALSAFALQAEQEPDLGLSRLSDFFVGRGQLGEAQALREILQAYPRSVVALGAVANLDFALRDRARLMASLEKLIPLLSRRAARNLPADRRISLADLFSRTNHADLAREQMTACLTGLEVQTLRTMTPDSVVSLLMLSQSLGIPLPDKNLETVALELIPPRVRSSFTPK